MRFMMRITISVMKMSKTWHKLEKLDDDAERMPEKVQNELGDWTAWKYDDEWYCFTRNDWLMKLYKVNESWLVALKNDIKEYCRGKFESKAKAYKKIKAHCKDEIDLKES